MTSTTPTAASALLDTWSGWPPEPDLDYLAEIGALLAGDSDADCLDAIPPASFDLAAVSDGELLEARSVVSEWDLPLLASIDPAGLDRDGRLDYLRKVEAVEGLLAAVKVRATVALAGADGSDSTADRHAAMEVAHLRRVGESAAASGIATARSLAVDFPQFLAALGAGEVSEWHCRELVSGTRNVTDPDTLAALQERLLPKARRRTPTEFRREVAKAVADLDAQRAAERVERARAQRYVTFKPLQDGMGYVGIVTDLPTATAMHAQITADGRALQAQRGGAAAVKAGDDDALADACRADAFAARVLGTVDEDGVVTWDRSEQQITLTVVMDLDTLRGEADRHALMDGEPIPADVGRDLAGVARRWRRAVTHPVIGHLLDYGGDQYLPDKLRDYILARDHCRVPGCTSRATSRLEMDHALPFPEGATNAANCGGLCKKHHQAKTEHRADLTDSAADGSGTWTTAWGQQIRIDPRPFLHDPRDHGVGARIGAVSDPCDVERSDDERSDGEPAGDEPPF